LQKGKHSRTGKKRHIGNLGPWKPSYVRRTVPLMGQTGYYQRTEYNKRILKIGADGAEVTPAGGFINYGIVMHSRVLQRQAPEDRSESPVQKGVLCNGTADDQSDSELLQGHDQGR
ncbi:MAG: 50S ribosomal protein L3, partial [Thermoplasmata archaeon]|nr:50S ribosomal protein L3 [Thermoplasmata archaeon]